MNTNSRKLSLDRFEPINGQARLQAQELLARGGVLLAVKKDSVQIVRLGQKATIDTQGRVVWESHVPQLAPKAPTKLTPKASQKPKAVKVGKAKGKLAPKPASKGATKTAVTVVVKKLKAA